MTDKEFNLQIGREVFGRSAWDKGVSGNVVHIIGKFDDDDICKICGRLSEFLCDAPLGKSKTCDMPLCVDCARIIGEDLHCCPVHFESIGFSKIVFVKELPEQCVSDNRR